MNSVDNTDVIQVLAKAIIRSVNTITKQLNYDKTFKGVVSSKLDNNKYEIEAYGKTYASSVLGEEVYAVGDIVWILAPCSDMSNLFIVRKG